MQEQLGVPRLQTREVNELVEARLQLETRRLYLPAEASLRLVQVLLVEQYLGEAEDGGERRAQLVRHAREEERAVAADALQLKVGALQLGRATAQLFDERLDAAALLVHRGAAPRVAERDDDGLPDAAHTAERRRRRPASRDATTITPASEPLALMGTATAAASPARASELCASEAAPARPTSPESECELFARARDLRDQRVADGVRRLALDVRVRKPAQSVSAAVVAAHEEFDAAEVPVAQEYLGEGLADLLLGAGSPLRERLLVEQADDLGAQPLQMFLRTFGAAARAPAGHVRPSPTD